MPPPALFRPTELGNRLSPSAPNIASSRLRVVQIELRYPNPVDVRPPKRAAIPVASFAFDDQFAGLNAALQALARFGSARLLQPWRAQTFDPHTLASTLQRGAVECAAAFRSRCATRQSHGQYGKY
jgi:hypothetical protein